MVVATVFFSLMGLGVKLVDRLPVHEVILFRALVALLLSGFFLRRAGAGLWGNNRRVLLLRGVFGTIARTGFALSLAGVAVIKGFDARVSGFYVVLGLMAALSSALAYNCIASLRDTENPQVIIFYFPLVTVPTVAPYTLTHWVPPTPKEWLLLVLIGVTVQTAQYFMTLAYQHGKASSVSIVTYPGVILALIYDWTIFDHTPRLLALAGMALVLVGLGLATLFQQQARGLKPLP